MLPEVPSTRSRAAGRRCWELPCHHTVISQPVPPGSRGGFVPCTMRGDGQNSPGHQEDVWEVVEPPRPRGPFQNQGTACEVSGSLNMSRLRLQQSIHSAETTGSEFLRGGWQEPSTLQPPGAAGPHPHLAQSTHEPRTLCGARSPSRQAGRQGGSPSSAGSRTSGEKKSKPQTRAQHRPAPCSVRGCSEGARQAFPPPRTEIPCRSPQRAVWDPGTSGNGFGEGSRPRWGSAEPRQTRNYSYKARILLSSSLGRAGAGSRGPGRAEHSSSPYKAPPGCRGHQQGPPGHYSQEGLALAPSSPAERHGGCGAKGQGPSVPTPSCAHAKAAVKESPGAPPCQVSSSAFVSVDKSEINPEQRPPWQAGRAAGPRAACSRPESPHPSASGTRGEALRHGTLGAGGETLRALLRAEPRSRRAAPHPC